MSLAKAGTSKLLSLNCGIMNGTYSVAVVLFTSERCWNEASRLMKAYNNLALLLRDQCETWPQPEASEMATLKLRHFEYVNASCPQLDLILIVLRMLMPAWRTWTFA